MLDQPSKPNKAKDGSWSEIRDGMRIDWDVPIDMDDGLVLRANVYRPVNAPPPERRWLRVTA